MTHYQKGQGEPTPTLVLLPSGVRPFSGHFQLKKCLNLESETLIQPSGWILPWLETTLKNLGFILPWYWCIGWFTHQCLLELGQCESKKVCNTMTGLVCLEANIMPTGDSFFLQNFVIFLKKKLRNLQKLFFQNKFNYFFSFLEKILPNSKYH